MSRLCIKLKCEHTVSPPHKVHRYVLKALPLAGVYRQRHSLVSEYSVTQFLARVHSTQHVHVHHRRVWSIIGVCEADICSGRVMHSGDMPCRAPCRTGSPLCIVCTKSSGVLKAGSEGVQVVQRARLVFSVRGFRPPSCRRGPTVGSGLMAFDQEERDLEPVQCWHWGMKSL